MSMQIYKFTLVYADSQTLPLWDGLKWLGFGIQHGKPCVWALVDITANRQDFELRIHGTGNPCPDDLAQWAHIGTAHAPPFVWHCFARPA